MNHVLQRLLNEQSCQTEYIKRSLIGTHESVNEICVIGDTQKDLSEDFQIVVVLFGCHRRSREIDVGMTGFEHHPLLISSHVVFSHQEHIDLVVANHCCLIIQRSQVEDFGRVDGDCESPIYAQEDPIQDPHACRQSNILAVVHGDR